ncbi:MAG TPA: hypothetical protein VGC79_20445 [Polyangiaceae bacterium]
MRSALFLGVSLSFLSAACTYDNGDARRILDETATCDESPATPVQTWIDTDAKIETRPGASAGVFVEYGAGGHWRLLTTCDTANNVPPCGWDIIITPEDGRSISNVAPEDLETNTDSVGIYPEYEHSYHLLAETGDDLDGITFDTEPGTAIAVDAFLDGKCALPYFFWVGDGAAHTGSPSNPLVLIPTSE